jgi:hypothetical protein
MRPKEVRDSPEGRLASAVYRQTSEYLKPFFRMLKNKVRLPCVGLEAGLPNRSFLSL